MFFSVITKNFNREILTKNLVTFLGGNSRKTNIYKGLGEKESGGGYTPMHAMGYQGYLV